MIDKFDGKYRFLSNFASVPSLGGKTVEHYYQASKTLDTGEKMSVIMCTTPGQAKRAGRRVTMREDWEEVKVRIMHNWLRVKFEPGTELANKLLATGGQRLVEGNYWHDNAWGNCVCERCRHIPGENKLGKLLMMVRRELK